MRTSTSFCVTTRRSCGTRWPRTNGVSLAMCRVGICCLLLSLIVWAAQETPVAQVAQALGRSGRSVVVLSDSHMGVGRDGAGAYSPFEHFRWSSELGAFLQAVDRQ